MDEIGYSRHRSSRSCGAFLRMALIGLGFLGVVLLVGASSPGQAQQATDIASRQLDSRHLDLLRRALVNPRITNPVATRIRNVFISDKNNICGEFSYNDRFGGVSSFVFFAVDTTGKLDVPSWGTTLPSLARLRYRSTCRRPI